MKIFRSLTVVAALLASVPSAFAQSVGANASISATTSSTNVALPVAPTGSVIIAPATGATAEVFYNFGTDNTVVATTSNKSLPSGGICVTNVGPARYLAAITASSTANVRITQINGGCPTFAAAGGGGGTLAPGAATNLTGSITNPSSTLTMTSATTAYAAGQLIATSATAGSVVNPSFAIANSAGGAAIPRVRLSNNDTTSTAWPGVSIQVDLWVATPTWTNGDRGAWLPATGAGSHLGSYSCTMSTPVGGDGYFAECAPAVGNFSSVKLSSGTSVFWSLKAVSASGVTGASKVWTLVPELMN